MMGLGVATLGTLWVELCLCGLVLVPVRGMQRFGEGVAVKLLASGRGAVRQVGVAVGAVLLVAAADACRGIADARTMGVVEGAGAGEAGLPISHLTGASRVAIAENMVTLWASGLAAVLGLLLHRHAEVLKEKNTKEASLNALISQAKGAQVALERLLAGRGPPVDESVRSGEAEASAEAEVEGAATPTTSSPGSEGKRSKRVSGAGEDEATKTPESGMGHGVPLSMRGNATVASKGARSRTSPERRSRRATAATATGAGAEGSPSRHHNLVRDLASARATLGEHLSEIEGKKSQ